MPARKRAASSASSLSPPPAVKKKATKSKFPEAIAVENHPKRQGYPAYKFPKPHHSNGAIVKPDYDQPLFIGAHCSIAGGVAGSLLRAGLLGANGIAMFLKGHRTWKSKPFEEDAVEEWKALFKPKDEGGLGYGPQHVLVHGNYLINLGNPDEAKWNQAYECFRDDVERCHILGIKLYNWHPGSTVGACSKEESFELVAKAINQVHKDVPEVITVIENMANAGSNILGTAFSDLKAMIDLVDDKERVRVCLDTCHLFAAGYDIRTPEAYAKTMKEFDETVGNKYLAGIHLNDSKGELGCNRDLHENIGLGYIGLSGFRNMMRDSTVAGIPMVLETPSGPTTTIEDGEIAIWKREIALLYEIQKIPDDEWTEEKEQEITERWRKERDKINPPKGGKPPPKKKAPAKAPAKAKGKAKGGAKKRGKKAASTESESEADDSDYSD